MKKRLLFDYIVYGRVDKEFKHDPLFLSNEIIIVYLLLETLVI